MKEFARVRRRLRFLVKKLIPPQISRLVGVALLIGCVYAVTRVFFVPASFGEYGFYRGDALQERAELPVSFAGARSCLQCHETHGRELAGSGHKAVSCESCHGPSMGHVMSSEDPASNPAKISDPRFCLRCHLRTGSRPKKFPQITEPDHSEGEPCAQCHLPHNPKESPE